MKPSATPRPATAIPSFTHLAEPAALGAERHAQTDFGRALRDDERHHAVNPERREQQGDGAEAAEERRPETIARDALATI